MQRHPATGNLTAFDPGSTSLSCVVTLHLPKSHFDLEKISEKSFNKDPNWSLKRLEISLSTDFFITFKSYLLFLMDAGSDLGYFEMLLITASGTILENPSVVFL